MPYGMRVAMAFVGGALFVAAVLLGLGEMFPSQSVGNGFGGAAAAGGLGFGLLSAAFVRRDG